MLVVAMTAAIVACGAMRAPAPVAPYVPNPGPAVSQSCLDAARRGVLVRDAPSRIGAYDVKVVGADQLYLRRQGRALSEPEGKAVFDAVRPTGLAAGHSALYSIYTCSDAPRASCLSWTLWLCQTSLERFVEELDAALAKAGAADGELAVNLSVLEARGPKCKPGDVCRLDRHYGSPEGTYEPEAARRALGSGGGRCDRDGDCEGQGSNGCLAWYLRGGAETLLYVSRPAPTFCGCIEGACTWFDQP